jgi:hypothetical protein
MPKLLERNYPLPKPIRNARFINCGEGHFAIVDKQYYDAAMEYKWCLDSAGGVCTNITINGAKTTMRIHQLILGFPENHVTWENFDKLDNRMSNLILLQKPGNRGYITRKQVRKVPGKRPSKYKGVHAVDSKINPWVAHIRFNYKQIRIGCFPTEERAARAYDKMALKLFGAYAATNKRLGLID